MTPSYPQIKDLVLIGGGHTHALVLRMWGMDPLAGARLTVINPDPVAPYSGMLPGMIAGHYRREDLMLDLVRLCRFAGARLILDRAIGLDPRTRQVWLAGRAPLAYDLASVDVGITSDLPDLPGADHAVSAKPLAAYAAAWEAFLARGLTFPRVVILGAGLGGVELALASAHRLRTLGSSPQITLIDRATALLPGLGSSARRKVLARLAADGIALRTGAVVAAIGPEKVTLAGGEEIGSDFTLTVAGARPHDWLAETGLETERGFLVTDDRLRTSDPSVFAAGDCATIRGAARPKAGVFAVRAAPVLHANLRAALAGKTLRRFRPQSDYLKLVALGAQEAVADKWGLSLAGGRIWRLKDRIDRQFIEKVADLPAMPRPAAPAPAVEGLARHLAQRPLCGGCGAKLGSEILGAALSGLPAPTRPEVLSGPGDDAAVLALPGGDVQVMTTDHLRAFTADPRLMARLTALHALGDVWAMGATPQVALAQVVLPPLGPSLQQRMLDEIMSEAAATFRAAGADVVGGHSTEGAELTVGFTVTGTARRVIGKGGARPGDALILTKPLGSGTILAAEMALARLHGRMLGEIWAACIDQMSRAQGSAAAILAPEAHAMTDVTGFGLAGHLLEMLETSGTCATIRLSAVPLMSGALDLAQAGYGSSLQPANLAAVSWRMTAPDDPRTLLLTDPQTAGGLLVAMSSARAEAILADLRRAGHDAALIGEVQAGSPHLTVTA
ncbi:selenide, water dikinase SelD [Tabrizicola sp. YIM 78059]|uniref:selenide, water dikinase SelD n=1 Tax=Tabrizicola sp. YIM 78059 TaxID=2529861 RepID=UPI0010AB49B0|nr:selenide, water dikinase SelD [Tabrizicola sp. YIM 78059]